MAADFWASSHCKALTNRDALLASHSADRMKGLTADQVQQLTIFHMQCVCKWRPLPPMAPAITRFIAVIF